MTRWERREVSEITKRSTASIVAHSSLHLAMTLVHVCLLLGVALLAAPTPLRAAPSQPAQAAANLLSVWQPEHRAAVPNVAQAQVGGSTARDGGDDGYTIHIEYGFPLYTFHIPFKALH
ncbi:hypothetical protein O3P69_003238 [Scylla paramamosain]|uniref:Uncharacterized protein n=1 Tax=Scylla paramamosain TaxID=85552 RepID=A0AAW0UL72_SCYPA